MIRKLIVLVAATATVLAGYQFCKRHDFASSTPPLEPVPQPIRIDQVTTADQATGINDKERVVGVVVNGHTRAYPIRYLSLNLEHVNDQIGGQPICVTW